MNFYRRSLPKFNNKTAAELLHSLYDVCSQKVPTKKFATVWKEKGSDEDFKNAKHLLTLAVELNHPDPAAPLSLATDASAKAVGGVLQQYVSGQWRPLGFFSRHLPPDKAKWSTFRRELWAIKEAVRHFNVEIAGRHLQIYTDHRPIVDAFRAPDTQCHDPIAYNHLMEVANFTSDVRFLSGAENSVADIMSRPNLDKIGTVYKLPAPEVAAVGATEATDDETPQDVAFETVDHRALAQA